MKANKYEGVKHKKVFDCVEDYEDSIIDLLDDLGKGNCSIYELHLLEVEIANTISNWLERIKK